MTGTHQISLATLQIQLPVSSPKAVLRGRLYAVYDVASSLNNDVNGGECEICEAVSPAHQPGMTASKTTPKPLPRP